MPFKQLKQIIQIKHNIVKNPNWPEADQLAIYKCGRGFELGRSVKQIQLVARAGLEPGTAGLRVRRADHSATLPPQSLSRSRPTLPAINFLSTNTKKKCLRPSPQLQQRMMRYLLYSPKFGLTSKTEPWSNTRIL